MSQAQSVERRVQSAERGLPLSLSPSAEVRGSASTPQLPTLNSLARTALLLTLSALLLALLPGCASPGAHSSHPIGEIHLFGLPAPLRMPGSALPTGVAVRIYASEPGGAQGLPIQQGRLDLLLFDQTAAGLNPQTQKPLKAWSFQPAELAPFRSATMMGTSYQLELRWDQDRPKGRVSTVVARYHRPDGSMIYSMPATIPLTAH